jgi:hypothetical protein
MRDSKGPLGLVALLGCALAGCGGKDDARPAPPNGGGLDAGPVDAGTAGGDAADMAPDDGGAAGVFLPREGTRLKIRWIEAPGGTRVFGGFRDSQLRVDCSFRRAIDGELRCLPTAFTLGNDFADASCTSPAVVMGDADCQAPEYIRRTDSTNACLGRERIYRRGEAITQVFTRTTPTGMPPVCSPIGVQTTSAAFRLGAELPVAMFVKAVDVPPPAGGPGGPLDIIMREAEDGARIDSGWQNTARDAACSLVDTAPDGRRRCLPPLATLSSVTYSDASCMQAAAFFVPACREQPSHVVEPVPQSCPTRYTVKEVGPAAPTVYAKAAATPPATGSFCGVTAPTAGNQYHTLGAAVAPDGFPALDAATQEVAGARLHARLTGPATGRRIVLPEWFDTTRNEICVWTSFGNGKHRCAPRASSFDWYYADGSCTRPLWRTGPGACSTTKYVLLWDRDNICPARARVHGVGAIHSGPVYRLYAINDVMPATLECQPLESSVPGETYNSLTPIAEDEFPEVTVREPAP